MKKLILFVLVLTLSMLTFLYTKNIQIIEPKIISDLKLQDTKVNINQFTGFYQDEKVIRPYAVQINNHHKALPQSGLSSADIIYETLVEGEITRLLAVFTDYTVKKIGPVRSSRPYFLDMAFDSDAIYFHHGASPQAYYDIKNRNLASVDGMDYEKIYFYRDKTRANISGMYEHSSYTNSELVQSAIEKLNFKQGYSWGNFANFYKVNTELETENYAKNLVLNYSYYQKSQFIYNEEKQLYERYQSGVAQIDDLNGQILEAKNIIILESNINQIKNDDAGRRNIETVGQGYGYLLTNGKYEHINWSKESQGSITNYFYSDGSKININKGKTWICYFPNDKEIIFN